MMLIPFIVLGHVSPHSHVGSSIIEPANHGSRPHFHTHPHDHEHGSQHEGHVHAAQLSDESVTPDQFFPTAVHDADAIYIAVSSQTLTRPSDSVSVEIQFDSYPSNAFISIAERPYRCLIAHPPDRNVNLPIYLLTASLRL